MTDMPEQETPKKTRNFFIMVDELSMAFLTKICPSFQFVEIEGMLMDNNAGYQLLVNPLPKQKLETQPVMAVNAEAEPQADA